MGKSYQHLNYTLIVMICLLVTWASGDTTTTSEAIMGSDDTTTAVPQNTSLEVTQGQSSSATDCTLTLQADKKEDVDDKIREVFQDNAVFIYFKLKISDLQNVYDNRSNVIDPTTWVWALEGKGELLLSYPFDFEQLSLGTLSLGVVNIEVPVNTPPDDCFQKATDNDKERILASFISSLVQSTNDTLNITNKEFYADKGAMVCLEKQRSDDFDLVGVYGFPLCTYYIIQGSTLYECWAGDGNPFEIESTLVRKHDWLGVILALGLIMALFSPLSGSFFIRGQELIERDGKDYIALNSDLPLGLKYLLCFSCQKYTVVVAARWFIYVVAFMIIPFIPFIVSYTVSGEAFVYRLEVAYELLLSKGLVIFWFIFVNVIFLAIAMLFLGLYLYDDLFSLEVKDEDRVDFGLVIPLTENLYVPKKPSSPKTAFSTFMYTMKYRTFMAINPALWSYWFSPIWNFTYGLLGGVKQEENKNKCRLLVTFLIFVIVFPFALILFCLVLLFNSVPLFYTVTWTVAKCTSKKPNAVEIFAAFSAMFLSFAVIFIFVAAFVYVAELIGYTFIGFVLNSDFAGPVVVVIITVFGYLVTAVTNFYDKYCVLLKRIIEKAEEVDKQNSKKPSGMQARPNSETEGEMSDTEATDHEAIELHPNVGEDEAVATNLKLIKYENGVPIIPFHLFKLVIQKYQPVYLEVAGIVFQLLLIAIVVAFGLTTIIFIDGVSDLPATVEFFATVVVAGVVPVLMLILKSPGKLENDDEVKARHLESDLEYYSQKETFEKMFL
ncbi:uncharacterized protein LOC129254980 [Lytechinus pictus]|uniref:uncharacterized protein LOC129254980 n=1 Tax=Lytechinus pictus TaxID=7653 RepID=UPI0030B9C00A